MVTRLGDECYDCSCASTYSTSCSCFPRISHRAIGLFQVDMAVHSAWSNIGSFGVYDLGGSTCGKIGPYACYFSISYPNFLAINRIRSIDLAALEVEWLRQLWESFTISPFLTMRSNSMTAIASHIFPRPQHLAHTTVNLNWPI